MSKQAVYQVRMDEDIKNQVEELYRNLGTTFAEAVRIFAVQSIREQGMPFTPSEVRGKTFGALAHLANPKLIPEEDSAFEKAIDDQTSTDNCLDYLRDNESSDGSGANIINGRKQVDKGFRRINHMSERTHQYP